MTESTLPIAIKNKMTPKLPPLWKRMSKDDMVATIEKYYGVVTVCCNILDCTYSQFYSAIDKWKLREHLDICKKNLVSKAEQVILSKMDSENDNVALKAAELTLKSKFAQEQGWGNNPQVNIQQAIMTDSDKAIQIKNIFGISDESV